MVGVKNGNADTNDIQNIFDVISENVVSAWFSYH